MAGVAQAASPQTPQHHLFGGGRKSGTYNMSVFKSAFWPRLLWSPFHPMRRAAGRLLLIFVEVLSSQNPLGLLLSSMSLLSKFWSLSGASCSESHAPL